MNTNPRVMFAAHDPGGARFLSPVIPLVRARGYAVMIAAAGPAAEIWHPLGNVATGANAAMAKFAPNLLVTGTSFCDFERDLWSQARDQATPSMAVIDAWTNPRRRFVGDDGTESQPDAMCVPDQILRDEIAAGGWCASRIHVTGHAHLQTTVRHLKNERIGHRPSDPPLIAFFSEPVIQDHGGAGAVGYDQFSVMDALVGAMATVGAAQMVVQPHPRENREDWVRWLEEKPDGAKLAVSICDGPTRDLLCRCDAAAAMTSMVLAEAALSGIASLSLQPRRKREINPLLGRIGQIAIVADEEGIATALGELIRGVDRPLRADGNFGSVLRHAERRLLAAIEAEIV